MDIKVVRLRNDPRLVHRLGIRQKNRSTTDYEQIFDPTSGLFIGQHNLNESTNVAPATIGRENKLLV